MADDGAQPSEPLSTVSSTDQQHFLHQDNKTPSNCDICNALCESAGLTRGALLACGANGLSVTDIDLLHHLACRWYTVKPHQLTTWIDDLPHFLNTASSSPYVMDALLSYSAKLCGMPDYKCQLWVRSFNGLCAAVVLCDASVPLDKEAIALASQVLRWQATHLSIWETLNNVQSKYGRFGAQSVMDVHGEYADTKITKLEAFNRALHHLQDEVPRTMPSEVRHWIDRFVIYFENVRRQSLCRGYQFTEWYVLHNWVLEVPTQLLQQENPDAWTFLTIAFLYAGALVVELLCPYFAMVSSPRPLTSALRSTLCRLETREVKQSISTNAYMDFLVLLGCPEGIANDQSSGFITHSNVTISS